MSVVLAVCGSNFVEVMSDGRMVEFNEYKEVINIVDEDYRKIFRVNEKVILGFTGNAYNMSCILDHLNSYINLKAFSFEQIQRKIVNKANTLIHDQIDLCILICGVNSNNKYEVAELTSKDSFQIKSVVPEGEQMYVTCFSPKDEYLADREKLVDNKISNARNLDELENYMRDFIEFISAKDETINDKVFKIKLPN